jgi:hypothetical protein
MWVLAPEAVVSIVVPEPTDPLLAHARPGDELVVRARCEADLDHLRSNVMPNLGPTVSTVDTARDYPFRAFVSRADLAAGLAQLVMDLDYMNVKSEVQRLHGPGSRVAAFSQVWSALLALEPERRSTRWENRHWTEDEHDRLDHPPTFDDLVALIHHRQMYWGNLDRANRNASPESDRPWVGPMTADLAEMDQQIADVVAQGGFDLEEAQLVATEQRLLDVAEYTLLTADDDDDDEPEPTS